MATMKQQLLRDIHIDSTTSGSVADTDVTQAIIEAIRYNRRFNLGFNQAQAVILTESSVQKYDLPRDYLGVCSEVLYSSSSTGTDGKQPLVNRPLDWTEANRYMDATGTSVLDLGRPWCYSIDPKGVRIAFSPIPSTTGERVEFSYVRDCGTPEFKYASSAWAFYKPYTLDTLPATFTNEYFQEGYYLIYNRAAFILWTRQYGGTEEAAVRGQAALQMWAEELARLRGEASRIVSGVAVRPRL